MSVLARLNLRDRAAAHPHGAAGSGSIAVSDTGLGEDADILARAGAPLRTTIGAGEGTGLGLSMVDRPAARSAGALREPGEDTAVRLWLPAVANAARGAGPEAHSAGGGAEIRADRPRSVLVVDDDALVLSATAAMVEDLGHAVAEAASGREALEVLRSPLRLDLMITDFAMPGMNGLELVRAAWEVRPGLPVILATGYADLRGNADPGLPRLAKPYGQDDLSTRIAQAMGEPCAPANPLPLGARRRG